VRIEFVPVLLVGGLATFVAVQAFGGTRVTAAAESPAAVVATGEEEPAADSLELVRRRRALDALAAHTYLPRLLTDGERILTRWPTDAPVRVWVSPTSSLRGWHPRMVASAREAFDDWRGVVPVDFRFVEDSASAQVIVTWRDSFESDSRGGGLVGHARRHYVTSGWITAAEVSLAVHAVDGSPLSPELIRAAALHEVGHVLGLPHSDAPDDIMAPSHSGVVTRLSRRDEATAAALYAMEPGGV
jgi:hypothetical protein